MLSNMYEETTKINRKRWLIAGAAVLAIVLFMVLCTSMRPKELSPEEIEKKIKGSAKLSRVDRLCSDLPKPSGVMFTDKRITGGNSFTTRIYHYYDKYSSHLTYDDFDKFYFVVMADNGWVPDSLGYEKGNQRVSISNTRLNGANYLEISCAEIIPKDGERFNL